MSYRDLLLHQDSDSDSGPSSTAARRQSYAISLAARLDARLTALVFEFQPMAPPLIIGGEIPMGALEKQAQRARARAAAAAESFSEAARRAGVSHSARTIHAPAGMASSQLSSQASVYDLTILGQTRPDDPLPIRSTMTEAALFDSGRPVLIVPHIGPETARLDRITIAWDGSRPATRAVHDALPLLRKAERIEIVVVGADTPASRGGRPGSDLAVHLARHGLEVTVENVPGGDLDVGNILLSHAADHGVDLLVMGGYGHSRFRQLVLGGATRTILESMTIPVLMSH